MRDNTEQQRTRSVKEPDVKSNHQEDIELREQLAAIEHERWSHWQKYMHSKLRVGDGKTYYELPRELVVGWERQIALDYNQLSAAEQKSDMEQVDRYWPLVQGYISHRVNEEVEAALERVKAKQRYMADFPESKGYPYVMVADLDAELSKVREGNHD